MSDHMVLGKVKRTYPKDMAGTSWQKNAGTYLLLSMAGMTTLSGLLTNHNKATHSKDRDVLSSLLAAMLGTTSFLLLKNKKKSDLDLKLKLGTLLPAFFWSSLAVRFSLSPSKVQNSFVPFHTKSFFNEGTVSLAALSFLALGYRMEKTRRLKTKKEPSLFLQRFNYNSAFSNN